MVTSYQTGASSGGGDVPIDSFSLNFAKVEVSYKEQKADGGLGTGSRPAGTSRRTSSLTREEGAAAGSPPRRTCTDDESRDGRRHASRRRRLRRARPAARGASRGRLHRAAVASGSAWAATTRAATTSHSWSGGPEATPSARSCGCSCSSCRSRGRAPPGRAPRRRRPPRARPRRRARGHARRSRACDSPR